ncbi:hypothetical protein N8940_01370 [Sphingomonadaceae bacterium]|nr:hypothetical protein [Sphingomonadaceae bacterium]
MPSGLLTRFSRRVKNLVNPPQDRIEIARGSPFEAVLQALRNADAEGRAVSLRDIHSLSGMTQPDALRCVEQLKREGQVHVETMMLDPLAGQVSLK